MKSQVAPKHLAVRLSEVIKAGPSSARRYLAWYFTTGSEYGCTLAPMLSRYVPNALSLFSQPRARGVIRKADVHFAVQCLADGVQHGDVGAAKHRDQQSLARRADDLKHGFAPLLDRQNHLVPFLSDARGEFVMLKVPISYDCKVYSV